MARKHCNMAILMENKWWSAQLEIFGLPTFLDEPVYSMMMAGLIERNDDQHWSAWFWECPISRLIRLWKWGVKQPCFTEELFILDVDHPVALRWEPKSAVVWLRSSLAKFRGVVCRTLVSQVAGGFTCAMEKKHKSGWSSTHLHTFTPMMFGFPLWDR